MLKIWHENFMVELILVFVTFRAGDFVDENVKIIVVQELKTQIT